MTAALVAGGLQPAFADAPSDASLVGDAAASYSPTNPGSAAGLVAAASTSDVVPLQGTSSGLVATSDSGSKVQVGNGGAVALSTPGLSGVALDVPGQPASSKVVDGALVQSGVAPATDLVTRPTDAGVQLTAVLSTPAAASSVPFNVTLPAGASMKTAPDGSITVFAPVQTTSIPQDEMDQQMAQAEKIIGDVTDESQVSQDQWAQLAALPATHPVTTTRVQAVAAIETPWAVDANGDPLPTHYELTGTGIKQVVQTDSHTAFPVTADPSWVWWVWTATSCAADIATFIFAAAKLAKAVITINSIIRRSARLTQLVERLGGAGNTLKAIYNAAKGFIDGNIGRYITSGQRLALASLASVGLDLIGDALGIGGCVSLVKEML